ncbi:unnamed protein product, partial [Ectocarpus sp. 12 AP-2014]
VPPRRRWRRRAWWGAPWGEQERFGAGPPPRVRGGGQSAPFHDEPYRGEAVRRRRGSEEAGPEHHYHGRERRREDRGRQVRDEVPYRRIQGRHRRSRER